MGGGIGMGNTCKPMAVSFQCITKSTTNKKKKITRFRLFDSNGKLLKIQKGHMMAKGVPLLLIVELGLVNKYLRYF